MISFSYVPRQEFLGRREDATPTQGKTAYVWSGGGMRASFGAGVSEALEEMGTPMPDFEIAISGNIGNRIYAHAGQVREYSRAIWRDRLCGDSFICDKRMDLDHLIKVFDDICPLDTETVRASRTEIFMPLFNIDMNLVSYFSNKDKRAYNQRDFRNWFLNVVRGGMAHPYGYKRKVLINNSHHIDGGFGVSLADAVELAAANGATRILVVDNENGRSKLDYAYAAYSCKSNMAVGRRIMRRLSKTEAILPDDVRVVHIAAGDVPASLLCTDPRKIEATIEAGRKAALEHPGLQEHFTKAA